MMLAETNMTSNQPLDDPEPDPKEIERGSRDAGYVLMLLALLLVPLVVFTGFAVDLGSWYARATQAQRAADAAALAGVTYLPDLGAATGVARDVAARNGFTHDPFGTGIRVDVDRLDNQELRVTIEDPEVTQYFSQVVFADDVSITRSSVAEYVLPVALGSPRNFLGTGGLAGGSGQRTGLPGTTSDAAENYWLSVNGPCSSREQGDWRLPVSVGNANSNVTPPMTYWWLTPETGWSWQGCLQGPNTVDLRNVDGGSHDPEGYYFGIRVPENYPGGAIRVQIYDAPQCAGWTGDTTVATGAGDDRRFFTEYALLDWDETPHDPSSNNVLDTREFLTGEMCSTDSNCSIGAAPSTGGRWRNRWCTMFAIITPQPGATYFVRVRTHHPTMTADNRQQGINSFGLRAWTPAGIACTTDSFDTLGSIAYLPDSCPQVYAHEWLSVFADFPAGDQASFFLSEIDAKHSGKTLVVSLYDMGEGTQALELLNPLGQPVGFDWEVVDDGGDTAPTGGWSGTVAPGGSLDILGTPATTHSSLTGAQNANRVCRGHNPQAGPGRFSPSKYNDRMLQLRVELPEDIGAAPIDGGYGGATWWRVRYTMCPGGAPTDRTTWSAVVLGDPVRLVR